MKNILDLTRGLGIPNEYVIPYGWDKAKIDLKYKEELKNKKDGKLVLVTAITPTKAGEGKTTTTIGLHDGLRRIGVNSLAVLREPSLGPVFGVKGGAAGGLLVLLGSPASPSPLSTELERSIWRRPSSVFINSCALQAAHKC